MALSSFHPFAGALAAGQSPCVVRRSMELERAGRSRNGLSGSAPYFWTNWHRRSGEVATPKLVLRATAQLLACSTLATATNGILIG